MGGKKTTTSTLKNSGCPEWVTWSKYNKVIGAYWIFAPYLLSACTLTQAVPLLMHYGINMPSSVLHHAVS
jgi:hypothetical protein